MTDRTRLVVTGFFDPKTFSVAYVAVDPATSRCAIIDPVLDFDAASGATSTHSADQLLGFIAEQDLAVDWIIDTHPHADHFSAVNYLKNKLGAPTAIGERVIAVQALWKTIYNLGSEFSADGSQWDQLFADGEEFRIGDLSGTIVHSPGHTLASVTLLVGDAAFVHDTIFMPDYGTARADFPGGDARALYRSIRRILSFPAGTRLFVGHDYRPGGREARWEATVAEQRRDNIHIHDEVSEDEFVEMREARDATLALPKLMLQALQVNIRGGCLPEPETNGVSYLKIPVNGLPR